MKNDYNVDLVDWEEDELVIDEDKRLGGVE
jgi:hypothetical protein